jgi:hypothetical protein
MRPYGIEIGASATASGIWKHESVEGMEENLYIWASTTECMAYRKKIFYLDAENALHACRPPTTVSRPLVGLSS